MGIMLTLLMPSMVIVAGKASLHPVIAQANSSTTVYLDPPTINGTVIGQEFTVSLMIRDAPDMQGWQAGMIFNATLLNCTGFFEGEFLEEHAGPMGTYWIEGTINNTAGVITDHGCTLLGKIYASGSGRLAYLTFRVKASGVSDLHLQDVKLSCWILVDTTLVKVKIPTNIIDVYTVIVDATSHKVVTVSNSTDVRTVKIDEDWVTVHSGFYGHTFIPGYGISFNVTSPYQGFSNVTIPEMLMSGAPSGWTVLLDGIPGSRTVTYNGTHYSIYFVYSNFTYPHTIQISSPHAIPEFPTAIILPLFMFFTVITVAITKKITIRKEDSNPPNTNN